MRTMPRALITLAVLSSSVVLVAPSAAFAAQGSGDDPSDGTSITAPTTGDQSGADDQSAQQGDDSTDDQGTDVGDDDGTGTGDDDGTDSGDDSSADPVAVVSVDHVRGRLTAFDAAEVTWRLSRGSSAPDEFIVELVPAGDGTTLTTTVDGTARVADLTALASATRYDVIVESADEDGTVLASSSGDRVRTGSTKAAVRDTAKAAVAAAKAAKRAAAKAEHAVERAHGAHGSAKAAAKQAVTTAKQHLKDAKAALRAAKQAAKRAKQRAEQEAASD